MNPFPAEHDLIELFEVEPSVLDRNVPWAYNSLTFETIRGADRVVCEIAPGYGEVNVRWSRNDSDLVHLRVRRVAGLTIERMGVREVLVGTFEDKVFLPLRLQLRPAIHLSWGTTDDPDAREPAG
jgi:hypothetical protein